MTAGFRYGPATGQFSKKPVGLVKNWAGGDPNWATCLVSTNVRKPLFSDASQHHSRDHDGRIQAWFVKKVALLCPNNNDANFTANNQDIKQCK